MKIPNIHVCFLFFCIIWGTMGIKYDTTLIDEMRNKLLQLEKTLERDLFHSRLHEFEDGGKYLWLIKSFKKFGDELEQNFLTNGYENLNALSSIWLWARTENELKGIDGLYQVFRTMQQEIVSRKIPLDIPKLSDFWDIILHDPNASIVRALTRIGDLIVHEKLFVSAYQEAASQICNENQSLQQLLYNLYTTVTLTEIKGYGMIQFSYKLLRLYNPGTNFTEEMEVVKQQYETRTMETLRAVKTAMAFAPRQLWRCDARLHKLDETYTKLTQLFQGYIVNEVDLNKDSSCRENCAYYEYSKVYGCYKNQFCSQQRKCNGRILKCEYIDSDMWICPSIQESDRRYEYIEYENGRLFGQKNTCKRETTKVDSWWRWLFWHCSYCFCYCDDNNVNSDRYFSLREVVSDVANNKVVTGIRFKKVKQIIHMQIQEGELMSRGYINKSSIRWKPIEEFSVLDNNVKNGVDYHTLSWEKRGLDLDDLVLDDNLLLTGLKFRMIGSRLNLEARMTSFNFTTGKLIKPLERSFWISHDRTNRTEVTFENPDIPTRLPLLALPDSKPFQYLNFAPSDQKSDVAQNTIPFIDIQPVESNPPVPIAGAGIFHKGRSGSGGFVAMRLITYDFSKHLQVDLSPSTDTVIDAPNEIRVV
ncbi:chemokine-like protein orion isoform X2 [Bombus fervidus]|uniref:chemokine-like protein orion isoform X2 n=1 Tax=Bombus fervidus TaxID=203811 RepID=UPI003AB5AF7D